MAQKVLNEIQRAQIVTLHGEKLSERQMSTKIEVFKTARSSSDQEISTARIV